MSMKKLPDCIVKMQKVAQQMKMASTGGKS